MTKVQIDIRNCRDCPFHRSQRHYTDDSFEMAYDWFCTKVNDPDTQQPKKVAGYVEWHEEKDVKVPEWCPIKVES